MHAVHRDARLGRAGREHGGVDLVAEHALSAEERQQRRMDVYEWYAGEPHEVLGSEDVIEPRVHDQARARAHDRIRHRRLRGRA